MTIHLVTRPRDHHIEGAAEFHPEEMKGHYTVSDCGTPIRFDPIAAHWSDGRICPECWRKHLLPDGYVNSCLFAVPDLPGGTA